MDIDAGAAKVVQVCAGVRKGENALIVVDDQRPRRVAEALSLAADRAGAKVVLVSTSCAEISGEPNRAIGAAMREADIIFAVTSRTMGHSEAVRKAIEHGARVICMTESTEATLTSGPIEADFVALQSVVRFVEERFNSSGRVHVTSPGGTDLVLDILGRTAFTCPGVCHTPGKMIGFPDVEVYIAPIEDSTQGTLVVDLSCSSIGLVKTPVTVTIEKGIATSIVGGDEAARLESLLASTNDPASRVVAEFAIGLNPKAVASGNIVNDEGMYGTGHFALGNNLVFGGRNRAPVHLDMVYWKPTITLDGQLLMRDGVLAIPQG